MTPASYWKQVREAYERYGNDECRSASDLTLVYHALPLALSRIEELEAELTRIKDETRDLAANWTRGSVDGCDRSVFVGDARNAILDIINGPALGKP